MTCLSSVVISSTTRSSVGALATTWDFVQTKGRFSNQRFPPPIGWWARRDWAHMSHKRAQSVCLCMHLQCLFLRAFAHVFAWACVKAGGIVLMGQMLLYLVTWEEDILCRTWCWDSFTPLEGGGEHRFSFRIMLHLCHVYEPLWVKSRNLSNEENTRGREDAKSLRRARSTLLSDLFLFKRWGITRQKATTWIIRPLRTEMYRQFRVAAPHWGFSPDGKPDRGGGSCFQVPLLFCWLKRKSLMSWFLGPQ